MKLGSEASFSRYLQRSQSH
uniref:Uncharacterized protein n=1 Tax=Arundo donax TaxID=35708 RepID=A0A0A9AWF1_ARUDO